MVTTESLVLKLNQSLERIARQLEIANRLKALEIEKSFVNYHNEVEKTYKDFENLKKELKADD